MIPRMRIDHVAVWAEDLERLCPNTELTLVPPLERSFPSFDAHLAFAIGSEQGVDETDGAPWSRWAPNSRWPRRAFDGYY